MPSPIGHLLAGLAVGWAAEPARDDHPPRTVAAEHVAPGQIASMASDHRRREQSAQPLRANPEAPALRTWWRMLRPSPFVLGCALAAALPDADLLIPHFHRTATHSLTATALILIITAAVTGKVTGSVNWRLAIALAAAHATHLLLDWLGADPSVPRGFQLLWPFSPRFFISDLDVFPGTERRFAEPAFFSHNFRAALAEIAIVAPIAGAAWLFRRTRRSPGRTFGPDARPRPSGGAAGTVGTSDRQSPRGAH